MNKRKKALRPKKSTWIRTPRKLKKKLKNENI